MKVLGLARQGECASTDDFPIDGKEAQRRREEMQKKERLKETGAIDHG